MAPGGTRPVPPADGPPPPADPDASPEIARAAAAVAGAEFLLVLTGSGVSAESGVPTFRGAGGYWRNHRATDLATPEAFARDPALVWAWYCERRRTIAACAPNPAHVALARWSERGPGMLVTQNVDGLHERAGHRDVVRFHGSIWRNRCAACGSEHTVEDLVYDDLPRSPCCGALERPGVTWFGEIIPEDAVRAALDGVRRADVALVVGTSGVVYPAAGIVDAALAQGARVIEVNPEPGFEAEVSIAMPAGVAVPRILAGGR